MSSMKTALHPNLNRSAATSTLVKPFSNYELRIRLKSAISLNNVLDGGQGF